MGPTKTHGKGKDFLRAEIKIKARSSRNGAQFIFKRCS